MTRGRLLVFALLLISLVASGISVAYAKYASRKLFVQLQAERNERDSLDTEWGRLQLELATWAAHGRIESEARDRLSMHLPQAENVVVLRVGP